MTAAALVINYADSELQRARIDAHAKAARDDGRHPARGRGLHRHHDGIRYADGDGQPSVVNVVPPAMARHIPLRCSAWRPCRSACCSIPTRSTSALLPVIARGREDCSAFQPLHIGQAALLGQMTTGFPVSPLTPATFLVVGLAGIELGDHQRYTAPYLFAASVVMTFACVLFGVFPL